MLLFLLLGFAAAALYPSALDTKMGILLLFAGLGIWMLAERYFHSLKVHYWKGYWIQLMIAGYGYFAWSQVVQKDALFDTQTTTIAYLKGSVDQVLKNKGNRLKINIKLSGYVDTAGSHHALRGRILAYLRTAQEAKSPEYGDVLLLAAAPVPVPAPQNPHAFDYRRYLYYQHIRYRISVKEKEWMYLEEKEGYALQKLAYTISDNMQAVYRRYLPDTAAQNLLTALVLGVRTDLDAETVSAFAATGTTHVLSVSGLHVGIIYVVIEFLLSRLFFRKSGKMLKALICIVLIAFYALLTGLSPCILRAALMIAFVCIGKAVLKPLNTYNLIACSAFLLLVYDPFLLMDVGFQLSYLALTGILFLQAKISAWVYTDTLLLRWIWELNATSIAAQFATLPLTVYYFHQFPNTFLLANLLVIPLSTLLLYGGLLVLAFAKIPSIAVGIGWVLCQIIAFMKVSLSLLQELPGAVYSDIYLDGIGLFCLIVSLGGILYCCFWPRARYWQALLLFILIWRCRAVQESIARREEAVFSTYELSGTSVLAYKYSGEALLFSYDSIPPQSYQYHIEPDLKASGIARVKILHPDQNYTSEGVQGQQGFWQCGTQVLHFGPCDSALSVQLKEQNIVQYTLKRKTVYR